MANGFTAWGGIFSDGRLARRRQAAAGALRRLAVGTRAQVLAAADDYLRESETTAAAGKSRRWLKGPATGRQVELLRRAGLLRCARSTSACRSMRPTAT